MKKYLLLGLIGGLFVTNLFAQSQKVADLNSFKSYLSNQNNARNTSADLREIRLADGRVFQFVINKSEQEGLVSKYYGVLQAPLKGGVFISIENDLLTGEIIQSDINKAIRFETK